MEKDIKVTCWGCRGSCPAPALNRLGYGGNTTCFVIETENLVLIMDGGTGLAFFGEELAGREKGQAKKEIHIFLSHLHLDHIVGIPFFKPLYQDGYQICFYGEERQGDSIQTQLERIFSPPYWPVRLGAGAANVTYAAVKPDQSIFLPNGLSLKTLRANHPDQTLLYRIFAGDKSIVYALDCELDEDMLEKLGHFAHQTDLLITDAQYRPEEYASHKGWGHSTWQEGAALAELCQAGCLWLSHFAWEDDDTVLEQLEMEIKATGMTGCYVREGMSVCLKNN